MKENLTILGTIKANKREIPPDFQKSTLREVHSTRFGFARDMTLVSYVPKKGKAVLLLSTLHNQPEISDREDRKPIVVLDYNKTKGAVDTIDQCIKTYSCSRGTRRWPTKVFFHIFEVATLNAFILWKLKNPNWNVGKKYRRRLFLSDLAVSLMKPQMTRRAQNTALRQTVRNALAACGIQQPQHPATRRQDIVTGDNRGRCFLCPTRRQTRSQCSSCARHVFTEHCQIVQMKTCDLCSQTWVEYFFCAHLLYGSRVYMNEMPGIPKFVLIKRFVWNLIV